MAINRRLPPFMSTDNVAKMIGCSRRTVDRVAIAHDISPVRFDGVVHVRHFWTPDKVLAIQSHLKAKPS